MHSQKLLHLFLTLCFLPFALCLTKRTAYVKIRNETPDPIDGAAISHKYSDVYKNTLDFSTIKPGQTSADTLTVEYNTGAFTTGRDWWLVTYHRSNPSSTRPGSLKLRYTDPSNFRSIIDTLEQAAPALIKTAINVAKGSNPAYLPAAKAAQVAAKAVNKLLFNEESTAGFKQHILRSEDEGKVTTVVIHADDTVTFESKSGDSETVTSSRWLPVEHA